MRAPPGSVVPVVAAVAAVAAVASAAVLIAASIGCSDPVAVVAADVDGAADADAFEGGDAGQDDAGDPGVEPRGSRVLGVAVAIDDVELASHVLAARDAGARSTNATFAWDDVERPVDGGTQLFDPRLHVVNLVLSDSRTQVTLALDALDVGGSRAPADLAARPLDDTDLGERYDSLVDYVLGQLPDTEINALLVASDVDVALGGDLAKHAAFATFLTRAAAHAHGVRPGLKVGFTVTHEGAAEQQGQLAAAWSASDVVAVTYLPGSRAATVRPVSEVGADVDRIVAGVPAGKPIVLREVGYPTAAATGGSELLQAAFVSAAFVAWDRHAARIPIVTFRELDEVDAETAARLAQRSGRSDAPFVAYLQSLGMRSGGRAKPGFGAMIRDARARGF